MWHIYAQMKIAHINPEAKVPLERSRRRRKETIKLLKPTGHVMHHQFNIQQLYALPTM